MKYQLRWTGHLIRMRDARPPKKLLFGELKSGKRTRGGHKKRFKDTLKVSLKRFNVDVDNWEIMAKERDMWRSIIVDGAVTSQLESGRRRIKDNDNSVKSVLTNIVCPECHRLFHARIGRFSHMRTHKP